MFPSAVLLALAGTLLLTVADNVPSKLKLSPIFAAARQPASTLRVGTLSATVMSSVAANARCDADGNIRDLLPSRVPDAQPTPNRLAAGHSPLAGAGQRARCIKLEHRAALSPRRANDAHSAVLGRRRCVACYWTVGEDGGLSLQLLSTA